MNNKKSPSKNISKLKALEERLASFNPKLYGEAMQTDKLLGSEKL